ncbi:MAG: preprotein translocase subunit SecG [Planctomycetales bacterium]
MAGFLLTLLALTSIFLMFIVLLQRGRGGGLAGAFGGLGGQSAFGTKAGDVFTKITVGVAVVWVILAGASNFAVRAQVEDVGLGTGAPGIAPAPGASAPEQPDDDAPSTPSTTGSGAGPNLPPPVEASADRGATPDSAGAPGAGGPAGTSND